MPVNLCHSLVSGQALLAFCHDGWSVLFACVLFVGGKASFFVLARLS